MMNHRHGSTVSLVFGSFMSAACTSAPAAPTASTEPATATVAVAPLERRPLTEELDVYGAIASAPAWRQTLSVPYEARIAQIAVRVGQHIDAGAVLIDVEPSPDTQLAMQQARVAKESVHETFAAVRERFRHQLATNQQFEQAEQAARAADLKLASLARRGSTRPRQIVAPGPAVVARIPLNGGAIAAAGSPLTEIELCEHREAVFGIEVEDLHRIEPGMKVSISDLAPPPVVTAHGAIRAVGDVVNPQTHLVD